MRSVIVRIVPARTCVLSWTFNLFFCDAADSLLSPKTFFLQRADFFLRFLALSERASCSRCARGDRAKSRHAAKDCERRDSVTLLFHLLKNKNGLHYYFVSVPAASTSSRFDSCLSHSLLPRRKHEKGGRRRGQRKSIWRRFDSMEIPIR